MKTKIAIFRMLLLAVPAALLMAFTTLPDYANFSGDWKLNEGKSELGEFGGRGVATALKVEQKADAITITRTTQGFGGNGPVNNTVTMTFDGKVTESEGFMGSKRKSSASWSADGKTLTISNQMNFERDGQSMEIKGTEVWTLGADGTLIINNTTASQMGEFSTKAIYNK
ncbi:MAG TPA: hypothetical protein PKD90_01110 [Phnomibacter sp.]|nr:hypothetical protein [Phnomibacter sp.]